MKTAVCSESVLILSAFAAGGNVVVRNAQAKKDPPGEVGQAGVLCDLPCQVSPC